jgi:hypothetical protein
MKVLRIITIAAASSAIIAAVAPSAQAVDLGSALSGTAKSAGTATRNAVPAAQNIIGGKVGEKVQDVQKTIQGGTEAVSGVNDLVS